MATIALDKLITYLNIQKEALKQINKLDYENLDLKSLRNNAKEFARNISGIIG